MVRAPYPFAMVMLTMPPVPWGTDLPAVWLTLVPPTVPGAG